MKNMLQPPPGPGVNELVWTNGTGDDVASGDVVAVGEFYGIAHTDIPDGEKGVLYTAGRFELPKATGSGTDLAQGAIVGWDSGEVDKTPAAESLALGRVAVAAAINDTTVIVDIMPIRLPA